MENRKQRPSIEEAKAIDLVGFLEGLGIRPERVARNDHWYLSPFRQEHTPSFKIDRKKNLWYDFGMGKGGNFISFGMLYYQCDIPTLLDRLSSEVSLPTNDRTVGRDMIKEPEEPVHRSVTITQVRPLKIPALLNYLSQRRIPLQVADKYTKEVHYQVENRNYYGIGFETDASSFEIRNPLIKMATPPKSIRTIDNQSNTVCVFEGFFDFLTFLTINPEQPEFPLDFVVLNSINQFEKARPFMEGHSVIKLFFDHDKMGRDFTRYALDLSKKYVDESKLYQGYNDLNDWLQRFGQGKRNGHINRMT